MALNPKEQSRPCYDFVEVHDIEHGLRYAQVQGHLQGVNNACAMRLTRSLKRYSSSNYLIQ